jgi:C-terminal processing protease CtpA/Prc
MTKESAGWLMSMFLLFSAVLAPAQEQGSQTTNEWTGSTQQKVWGLMTVWAEAKYAFPHFERLSDLDWDRAAQQYIPRVIAAEDMEGYYRVLSQFVAMLKDSHTSIVPPWGHFKPGYDLPPIEVQVIEDRFLITRAGETDDIESQRIYPGLEIVEIDGNPVRKYFEENVLKYHSRGSKQADEAILTIYLFYGPQGEKVIFKVKDVDGVARNVTLTRSSLDRNGNPFMYRFVHNLMVAQTIESKLLDHNILYVNIPHFENDRVQADFQNMIDDLDPSGITGMIIDLRYNLGGSSTTCNKIVSCLIDEPVMSPIFKYRHYIAAEKAWGREPQWSTDTIDVLPREGRRYLGPLVVLSGPSTNSAAEDFIIELQYTGRAKIVGEKTAGGAGNALVSALPGGGSFRVTTFTAIYPGGQDYVGKGVAPDVEVHPTRKDISEGRDPILEKAIHVITN